MKADFRDFKHRTGEIRLFPETIDDLWHLRHLVGAGDLVFALTFRSLDNATDKIRPEKVEKKPVRLGVRVEKVEFHPSALRLRISGPIEHGPDIGSYHTLNIEPGQEVSVIKTWRPVDLERVDRAAAASTQLVHVAAIEEGEAQIFRIRQYGPEEIAVIRSGSGKREGVDARSAFFAEVIALLQASEGPVILSGPGFVKEDLLKIIRKTAPELALRCTTAETRRSGRGSVQEVIGKGVLERITEDLQLAREVQYIDELLKRIGADDGTCTYGYDAVLNAVRFGAVETLLVVDENLRDQNTEALLEEAEGMRAAVVVLSADFEPGAQLSALGGVAALLRFAF